MLRSAQRELAVPGSTRDAHSGMAAAQLNGRYWLLLLPCGVALVGIATQFLYLPNDDATWLIAVARRILGGATLYSPDVIEINPPLIIWMTTTMVQLSAWLGVEAVTAWRLYVASQVLLSLGLSARILSSGAREEALRWRIPLLTFLAWVLCGLTGYNYGQREHFIVLWMTPYLFLRATSFSGVAAAKPIGIAVGILLGLTLCVKPHYAAAVLLVEIGVAAHRRSLRAPFDTTPLSAVTTVLIFALALVLWSPGFFSSALPLALAYYPAFGVGTVMRPVHWFYVVMVLTAVWLTRTPAAAAIQVRVFALAGAGAFAAFLSQGKGWPYQFLPSKVFFLIATAVALAAWAHTNVERGRGPTRWVGHPQAAPVAISIAIAVIAAAWIIWDAHAYDRSSHVRIARSVASYVNEVEPDRARRRFAVLSTSLHPGFPVNEMIGGQWSSRFSCFWTLPGIIAAEEHAVRAGLDPAGAGREALEEAASEDFERWVPDLVLVEESQRLSVLHEFLKSGRFAAIWRNYELVGAVEYFQVFRRARNEALTLVSQGATELVDLRIE